MYASEVIFSEVS